MTVFVGKDAKVTLGTNTVVGMGTWAIDGVSIDEFDASAFGDNWKQFAYGMKDGGTISFNGHFDPTDDTGQIALQKANLDNTPLTSLYLYYNRTSYFAPNQTAGFFAPTTALSSGQDTPLSSVRITSFNIGMDKAGLGTISFTAKVSGLMVRAT